MASLDLDTLLSNFSELQLAFPFGGGVAAVGLGAGANSTTNKRLHVNFMHGGVMPMMFKAMGGDKKLVDEKILGSLWQSFGQVTDTYYHAEYAYGFLSFETHDSAKVAMEKLNDGVTLRTAINALIEKQTDARAKTFVQDVTSMLFSSSRGQATLIRASWAATKRGSHSRYRHNDYGSDNDEYVDDCPDNWDRAEWNNYCESRD